MNTSPLSKNNNPTKILFLDHDGVICLDNQWGGRYQKREEAKLFETHDLWSLPLNVRFDDFDQECVAILNEIITQTDCEIVVSSDWRKWATVEEMGDYYQSQGIMKRPIDFTPTKLPEGLTYYYRDSYLQEVRSYEILQWLSEHPEVTHWVAIDDLDMRKTFPTNSGMVEGKWGLTNFVWTVGANNLGLNQKGKLEEVMEYLS